MAFLFLPKFKYYLTYENVRVQVNFAPEGWDKETIATLRRDIKYWGLMRTLSLPLRFVFDGRDILRECFGKYGMEGGVRLEVEQIQRLWNYKNIFTGDMDLSQIKYDTITFEAPIMESGISRDIKAKDNVKYEIPFVGDDVVNIVLPGIKFEEKGQWTAKYVDTTNLNAAKRFIIGVDYATNSINSGFLIGLNTEYAPANDDSNFTGHAFVKGNRAGGVECRITGTVKGYVFGRPLADDTLCELIILNTVTKARVNVPVAIVSTTSPQEFNVKFDFTYTIQQGEGLCLYSRADSGSSSISFLTVNEGEIFVSYATVSDPSNCKGLRIYDVYRRLLARISPTAVPNSSLLINKWANLIVTSGSAIRELPNAVLKTSFNELFDTVNAIEDAGFGTYEGFTRIETKPFFMRNIMTTDIGNVRTCEISVAVDLCFNSVKVGYPNNSTEEADGLEDYNAGQNWNLPLTRIIKEQSFVSPYKASQFEIEKQRVKYNIKKQATADVSQDNDVFMIHCNPIVDGNFTPILGSQYESVTGLTYPLSAYNLEITPKQNLLRKAGYLRSILDKQDSRFIEFGSAEKNANLKTIINGMVVLEKQSIAVSSLGGKYFMPYIAEITVKNPQDMQDKLDANPFGYIQFNHNDVIMQGFVIDAGVDLTGNTERTFKLLLTADSNIC